jgi:DnaA-homolog protein
VRCIKINHPADCAFVLRQLLLKFDHPTVATFEHFVVGANTELLSQLVLLEETLASGAVRERLFFLWGDAGCGRSHLLQALCQQALSGRARLITPNAPLSAFVFDPAIVLYAIDDSHALSPQQQISAFNLFNEVQAHPDTALIATGNVPPRTLAVREDLRTRFGSSLVFQIAPLDDRGKLEALSRIASARGIKLNTPVLSYLITHYRRDMPALIALLNALDRFSLEYQRPITLPFVQAVLARTSGQPELLE